MNLKKYLKQIAIIFNEEQRACNKKKQCLQLALKKLKQRKNEIKKILDTEKPGDKSRKRLKDELKVITAQRKKGIKILKELRKG